MSETAVSILLVVDLVVSLLTLILMSSRQIRKSIYVSVATLVLSIALVCMNLLEIQYYKPSIGGWIGVLCWGAIAIMQYLMLRDERRL